MQSKPKIVKEPAANHTYGSSICRRGNSVWAAYSGDTLILIAATAKEARRQYRVAYNAARGVRPIIGGYVGPVQKRWDDFRLKPKPGEFGE
jgi:hypothetical protein